MGISILNQRRYRLPKILREYYCAVSSLVYPRFAPPSLLSDFSHEAAQAAFYPGAIYLLSRWYTRKVRYPLIRVIILLIGFGLQELAFRSAILYAGLLVSNAFGSVSKYQHIIILMPDMI